MSEQTIPATFRPAAAADAPVSNRWVDTGSMPVLNPSTSDGVRAEAAQQLRDKLGTDGPPPAPRTLTVAFLGEEYRFTESTLDDVEVFENIEKGRQITAIEMVLGPNQWTRLKTAAKQRDGRFKMSTLNEFMQKVIETAGPLGSA